MRGPGGCTTAQGEAEFLPRDGSLPSSLIWQMHRRLLPLLGLGYVFCLTDRVNIAYAQLQMQHDLGLSTADFGLASGIFFFAYAIMQMPSNGLVARVGARQVLATTLTAWGALSAAMSLVGNAETLYLLRFAVGLAESGYFPGVLLFLSQWYPEFALGSTTAIFMTSSGLGTVLGTLSAGAILGVMDGVLGLRGWRWLFMLQGLPPMMLGPLLWWRMVDGPSTSRWLSPENRALLLDAVPQVREPRPFSSELCATVSRPATWVFALTYMFNAIVMYSLQFFTPMQLQEIFPNLSSFKISLVAASPMLIALLIGPLSARWSEYGNRNRRRVHLVWGTAFLSMLAFLLCGLLMLLAAMPQRTQSERRYLTLIMSATTLVLHMCMGCVVGPIWALHMTKQPIELLPTSIALVNSIGNLGGFVGPYALGVMHDALGPPCPTTPGHCVSEFGWGTAILAACGLVAIGTLALLAAWLGFRK